jgi:hypothetical protein
MLPVAAGDAQGCEQSLGHHHRLAVVALLFFVALTVSPTQLHEAERFAQQLGRCGLDPSWIVVAVLSVFLGIYIGRRT